MHLMTVYTSVQSTSSLFQKEQDCTLPFAETHKYNMEQLKLAQFYNNFSVSKEKSSGLLKQVDVDYCVINTHQTWPGYTSLHFAAKETASDLAQHNFRNRNLQLLFEQLKKLIIDFLAAYNTFRSDSPLLSLIKNQKNEEAKLSIKKGKLYNAIDESRNRLLHYAAEYGNPEIVQFLLDSGSKVNAKNNLLQTPLIKSFIPDIPCKKVIELLLTAGADIEVTSRDGKNVFRMINSSEWLSKDTRRFEILKMFLDRAKNINYYNVLVFGDRDETIKSLLQTTDVNLRKRDANGQTIVHILATNSNPGVIEQLRGSNYDVNVSNNYGQTPLTNATFRGLADSVEFLLSEGADVEATDSSKITALYVAIHDGHFYGGDIKKTVQVLLEYGANPQIETSYNEYKTAFDCLLADDQELEFDDHEFDYELAELILAQLALQEALGTAITDLIRSKIDSNHRFKSYFENCQQLSMNIYSAITLLDLLTASKRKLERYFHNEQLVAKLINLQTKFDYFDTILNKHFAKASRMVKLRKTAAQIVCKLMKMNYECYPFFMDEIAGYLHEKDIECLVLIQSEIS